MKTQILLVIFLLNTVYVLNVNASVYITEVEPTPFFPKVKEGESLKQVAKLTINNTGEEAQFNVRLSIEGKESYIESLGNLMNGLNSKDIHILDIEKTTRILIEILSVDGTKVFASKTVDWQPQWKWSIYAVSYSHHDHGYGGYPHRLRTEIRHANIRLPLEYCRKSDDWDEDSKFRYVIETAEPITSFLNSINDEQTEELGRRIREGRIQLGGLHSAVYTEMMGHELMARLFYLSGRHTPDLLNVKRSLSAQNDDVIGLTWPMVNYMDAADIPYLFHGHNSCGESMQPAQREPIFNWTGPGNHSSVLMRSTNYTNDGLMATEKWVNQAISKYGRDMPCPVLLVQDASDFRVVTMRFAEQIREWNSKYAYPRMISSTMDMYFEAIVEQTSPDEIKSFAGDANNQWADQDATDARNLAMARRMGEELPSIEKFSTITQLLLGGGSSWKDLYQAYHRLLIFHEHTNARTNSELIPNSDVMKHYETELMENREMLIEVKEYARSVKEKTLSNFADAITTKAEQTVVVFNPLSRKRTDKAFIPDGNQFSGKQLRDAETGEVIPIQQLEDGSVIFIARDVPSVGYKSYIVETAKTEQEKKPKDSYQMENSFYRILFDKTTGTIGSIYDKKLNVELVDQESPHKFNQYLYQQYEGIDGMHISSEWFKVEKADSIKLVSGPISDIMTMYAHAKGVEKLEQTITLHHQKRQIDFTLDLIKSPSGRDVFKKWDVRGSNRNKEAIYIALPFAIPDFSFYHELPGAVIEPIRDQFDGSGTAHYGIRHFTDVSNPDYGVTVSATESGLVQYGWPRSDALIGWGAEHLFEQRMTYPNNSRMYLYLTNNMFSTNIRIDQQGPLHFSWSVRSHEGDWKKGKADEFGWDVMNPFWVSTITGKKQGKLPVSAGFVNVNQPNVTCLTIKPAEFNSEGFILRFNETQGRKTKVVVDLAFIDSIKSANETSLLEEDKPGEIEITNESKLSFSIEPFGIKTIRVLCEENLMAGIENIHIKALSDMEIDLSWEVKSLKNEDLSHYNVYRSTKPDFEPSLLNLVQRPKETHVIDRPKLNYGGWINNRLEPNTAYYYRVAAVDRWNNQGVLSVPVKIKTRSSNDENMKPLQVEALRAVHVSPISNFNFVNLLWRTTCESDIETYEIYRSENPDFNVESTKLLGTVEANAILNRGKDGHGQTKTPYRNNEYDHMMFEDKTVNENTKYYYRVRAVDNEKQAGPFSETVFLQVNQLEDEKSRNK